MRVLIQWATATALDYTEYSLTGVLNVRALPRKAAPVPGVQSVIDNLPGWYAAVNIQGITFTGYDVIGLAFSGGVVRVYCRNDGSDFAVGERWGQIWELRDPAPDPALGGVVNTRQSVTWYGEAQSAPVLAGAPNVQSFASMPMPTNPLDRIYGVWVTDRQWAALTAARSTHDWREWVV